MLSTKLSMKFQNMRRRSTKKAKLYSGASSAPTTAPIEPASAGEEQEKPPEEKKPSEETTKEGSETSVEDKGPTVTHEENLEARQEACTENKRSDYTPFVCTK